MAFLAAFLMGEGHPDRRLGALAFLAGALMLFWIPLLATARGGPRAVAPAAAGILVMLVPPALLFGGSLEGAILAGPPLAAFALLLAGIALAARRATGSGSVGVAAAGLLGAALLASFHLGDPVLEWGGPGRGSSLALGLLHAVNPMSGAVGSALAVDWLRYPILYGGFPGTTGGGLSAAQFYEGSAFPWWGTTLLHGAIGLALLAGARRGESL